MAVPQGRRSSNITRLLRHGFTDASTAQRLLDAPELAAVRSDPVLLEALGATADPDLALLGLVRLVEALPEEDAEEKEDGGQRAGSRQALLDTLVTAKPLRDRLLGVLGASEALGDHLARHPGDWHALVTYESADLHPATPEFERALAEGVWGAPGAGRPRPDALRVAYRRALLAIAARDVCGTTDITQTAAELADLATATVRAALEIAAEEQPQDAAACRLAVIGMGKCGGRELNYVSDVDVIFVAEAVEGVEEDEAVRAATRLASRLMRVCSDVTVEGTIWPVDANLRPEGRNGPLVRTLSSHLAYYQRWAKTWEFQALLKARPMAGDAALGQAYVDALAPMVWQAVERENFIPDVQQMRRRVVENIPVSEVDRELKLGPGGLRDVEFAVQLLQLVHGRSDESLRSGTTLDALAALAAGGYVGRTDAAALDDAYRFLRTMEHRLQLYRLRRTHLMPEGEADQRRLGRSLGFRTEPVTELGTAWRRHAREVRRLHEKLFYRPLLDAVAQLQPGEIRLSSEAAGQRLTALGYADPAGALRHLEALASGVTRKAAIQRTLLPVLLGWFADSADPDAGLLGFRKVSDALGKTPWYLRLLRDEGAAAENLARVLSAGRLAPDLLLRAPEAVALLGDLEGLRPRGRAHLEQEVLAAVGRADGAEQAVAAARGVRRREMFRTAAADIIESARLANGEVRPTVSWPPSGDQTPGRAAGAAAPVPAKAPAPAKAPEVPSALRDSEPHVPPRPAAPAAEPPVDDAMLIDMVGDALSDLNAATLAGALRAAVRDTWGDELPTRFAVIGVGRFGGHELSYGSDADVLFVHEPREGADDQEAARAAFAVANEMRRLLQLPTVDPPLLIDADLRPEGKSGPLVRTLASYAAYYRRWSLVWESQALLRAEPVAGDPGLGERFIELIDPLRYPAEGLGEDAIREIRRLKARMESERLPRGADPTTHAKLGRGGLSDVEWTVQLLQMRHGWAEPGLRTTRTREALAAAHAAELISTEDAQTLDEAWILASRVRNAVMLVRGRPGDTFPTDVRELAAVGRYLGYGPGHVGEMLEDYRRTTRRARAVVERLFYDYES
ncbi:bifunctional [glutamine synthetase] adenylyltransferase/[glutamine synthetase]-adenylyl-L-tyrosine phosphorylase [Streptomyces rapamycinicus]|uniref:Bifunctional glutamine synthetase adenylyltransferase/adenylyl-removing enzyme n=2 Tax=Streptomyces rapamycinicus TaxID=1226757 RepID=A0A0A0NUI4_STRRN|nr:bifunctional [glutamine synthetase] adenylyltransferase/[glutamine synthetase]-adenylyl-L-tyrosine phosphorylase [Streptomyces rapamycinicus]AGP58440.1 glutamine-synthetase adenylyltransferase [Streptomyces rapamycinicus NRRL 5491]MBB4786145.1 glutamate-ammonia-ligase adenylyltransferase [Streptomyces rapamycinicus]RLV78393.1 bifunctional glutamine-synthetase adenylyltransferase/deadenyltransferase [Streptomyces rapamycinicus NRRL 5491]UTO66259.1 bifunctional [glutamine synthetase] adenylylt